MASTDNLQERPVWIGGAFVLLLAVLRLATFFFPTFFFLAPFAPFPFPKMLCASASEMRRLLGIGIALLPEMYGPVTEARLLPTC